MTAQPPPTSPGSDGATSEATALLFPGQGSQRVGMGQRLTAEHAVARATMAEADDALDYPLTRLCFEGPEAELTRTEFCQPAILAVSVACWRALGEPSGLRPRWVAGHSLGEYTALVVAGALAFRDAVRLVRLRGRLMQSAVPEGVGTMAAIVGLDDARVAELCAAAAAGEVVSPANFNGAGQVVIAGHRTAVTRAMDAAKAAGGRVIPLTVSAPFHCALMAPVASELASALAAVEVSAPCIPIVANVDAALNAEASRVRDLLTKQVTAPVRWVDSMRLLQSLGCTRALEVGPGQVLAKLLQRMKLGIASASLEETAGTVGARVTLAGHVAIVTGASRGIGAAIARDLATAGAHVVVGYRTQQADADAVVAAIVTQGGSAEAIPFDVASGDEVDAAVRAVVARLGKVDILVNNAGVSADALIVRISDEQWQRVLDVNLKGVFNCTKAVARPMMRARSGRIINLSSVVGVTGNAGQAAYAAAKAGIIGFTKSTARELASRGITANVVAPGIIETDMTEALDASTRDMYRAMVPLGRMGRGEDVAAAVTFLAGPGASYITGQVIHINGGMYV